MLVAPAASADQVPRCEKQDFGPLRSVPTKCWDAIETFVENTCSSDPDFTCEIDLSPCRHQWPLCLVD